VKLTANQVFYFNDELSNQVQRLFKENFSWRLPAQDLAWTVIQFLDELIKDLNKFGTLYNQRINS